MMLFFVIMLIDDDAGCGAAGGIISICMCVVCVVLYTGYDHLRSRGMSSSVVVVLRVETTLLLLYQHCDVLSFIMPEDDFIMYE